MRIGNLGCLPIGCCCYHNHQSLPMITIHSHFSTTPRGTTPRVEVMVATTMQRRHFRHLHLYKTASNPSAPLPCHIPMGGTERDHVPWVQTSRKAAESGCRAVTEAAKFPPDQRDLHIFVSHESSLSLAFRSMICPITYSELSVPPISRIPAFQIMTSTDCSIGSSVDDVALDLT